AGNFSGIDVNGATITSTGTGTVALIVIADAAGIANPGFRFFGAAGTNNTLQFTGAATTPLDLLSTDTLAKIRNLQKLDMLTSLTGYSEQLPKAGVRAVTGADHTLVVTGDNADRVALGNRWRLGADEVIGGVTLHGCTQDDVTVKVQQGVTGAFATQTPKAPVFAISPTNGQVFFRYQEVHGAASGPWSLVAPGAFLSIIVSTASSASGVDAPFVLGVGIDHRVYMARFNADAPFSFDSLPVAPPHLANIPP